MDELKPRTMSPLQRLGIAGVIPRAVDLPAPQTEPQRIELAWKLWFEQFRQISWLDVVAIGGGLILVQANIWKMDAETAVSLGCFALSAITAVLGQVRLVEYLTEGKAIDKNMRLSLKMSVLFMGMGAGAALLAFFE